VNPDDRRDDPITNPISAQFKREYISDPLYVQAQKPPAVFVIMYKRRPNCKIHEYYCSFLKEKEDERIEAQRKRKEEIIRQQEDHAFNLKMQRERDRMIALHYKKQGTIKSQIKQIEDQIDRLGRN